MSVIFVVTPVVVGGWPVVAAAAAAAAAALGYRKLEAGVVERAKPEVELKRRRREVQLEVANAKALAEGVREDDRLVVGNDHLRLTIARDAHGRVQVHVDGEAQSDEDLRLAGERFIAKLTQQYAYQKVVAELKGRGFTIVDEGVREDQTIRVRFRKFE